MHRAMKTTGRLALLLSVLTVLLSVSACRKRAPAAPASTVPPEAMFKVATATTPSNQLKLLTDAMTTWEDLNGGRAFTNLNQLVEGRVIDQLPDPPPGRKFAIDGQKHQVVLVNQ